MSLNRSEQRLFDYVQAHPEERHHWEAKVRNIDAAMRDPHAAANRLESELWRYYQERNSVVPALREVALREGMQKTSMKNLAEYLLRLWAPPRIKKPAAPPLQ
jgi:hypothetical protein